MAAIEIRAGNRIVRCLLLSTAMCLVPGEVLGQTLEPDTSTATTPESATPGTATGRARTTQDATDIVVTGSRIRGVAPVGSSVVAISTADIAISGATTTTELIQQVPQVFNLGVSESSRGQSGGSSNITYGSAINLRGIGPYTTLSIVNGHRVVPQGTTGFAVDPSIIPTLGLERVEIVADGASAIYGSDAVAGVVNLILRRNVEGIEANARYGFADDYSERQLGLVGGHRWATGQLTVAIENGYHSALNGRDRDFYRANLTGRGGNDFRVTTCAPGNIILGGVTYAIPAGGVTAANRSALTAGTPNRCDTQKSGDLLPRQNHISGSFTFNQDIGDRVRISMDGLASRRRFKILNGAAASTLNVPSTNAFFVAPPGTTPASETVAYSFENDYPQGFSYGYSKGWNVHGGVEVKLPFEWKAEANYGYGWNKDVSIGQNVPFGPALTAALASSNPATAFNPFGGANSAAVINSILVGVGRNPGRSIFQTYEAKLDGPLFALPGGEVRAAVGYDGQNLKVKQGQVNGAASAPTVIERNFQRKVDSFYAEVLIPLFGSANAVPGLQTLELNAAVRYDRYSDVGDTTNPKFGVNWSPVRGLTLRGSYGTSFRAPTISQIYGNTNTLFVQNYSDPTCGCIRQGVARSGSNLDLQPETARTWSIGADIAPVSQMKVGLTYWDLQYENQVTAYLSDLALLQREGQFAGTGIIVRDPPAALIAQQIAQTNFTGVLPTPITLFVDGRNNNLGKTLARGIDFQASYRIPAGGGSVSLGVNGTYLLEYKVAITPTAPLRNQRNLIFNPMRFRARANVGWSHGPIDVNAFLNYVNAYTNNLSNPVQRVTSYTPVDLYASYTLQPDTGFLNGLRLSVQVKNLLDEKPPFVNIAQSANGGGGFDPTSASPIGRVVSLIVSKKF